MSLERIIFASDLHGDLQDHDAVEALLEFTKEWKPHHRIFGGDLFDFRPLRRGASKEEKAETIQYDLDAGLGFLGKWKPHYWLRGNHDERLWDFTNKEGLLGEFAQKGVSDLDHRCKKLKIKTLPYCKRKGVLEMGKLKMLHGYFHGVNAARQHGIVYGNCIFGHIHAVDTASVPGLEKRQARAVGCLCRLDHPYNERLASTLRHSHGWGYGVIDSKTGGFELWQMQQEKDLGWIGLTKPWQIGPKH